MDESNTSLELKFSVELKTGVNIDVVSKNKKEKDEKQENKANFEDSLKQSIFWKMYLKRKSGLEEMNNCVEDLVRECLFWKQHLESLTYQNWLLEAEKRSLRNDYEDLLEKTRHDMNLILKLKDSKKELDHETEEYFRTDKEFLTMQFINKDLASDKLLLESEKSKLLDSLKKNTGNMKRINEVHNRIQSVIQKEKERYDSNSKKFKEELEKLNLVLSAGEDAFENFKKNLANRKQLIADLESFLDIGITEYLGLDSEGYEIKEPSTNLTENTSEIESSSHTEKNEKEIPKEENNLTEEEKKIMEELRKNKINSQVTENENFHLLKHYDHLHNRMKDLNERYMELTDRRNLKEAELHRCLTKASDLYQIVLQKRKKFTLPPRDEREELRIRIRTKMNENEVLRKLLSLSFSYTDEDLQFHIDFINDLKEFCTRLFHQEQTETKSSVVTEKQTIPNTADTE